MGSPVSTFMTCIIRKSLGTKDLKRKLTVVSQGMTSIWVSIISLAVISSLRRMSNPYKDSRPFRAITARHAFGVAIYQAVVRSFFRRRTSPEIVTQEVLKPVDLLTRIVYIETKFSTEGEGNDGTEEDRLVQIE